MPSIGCFDMGIRRLCFRSFTVALALFLTLFLSACQDAGKVLQRIESVAVLEMGFYHDVQVFDRSKRASYRRAISGGGDPVREDEIYYFSDLVSGIVQSFQDAGKRVVVPLNLGESRLLEEFRVSPDVTVFVPKPFLLVDILDHKLAAGVLAERLGVDAVMSFRLKLFLDANLDMKTVFDRHEDGTLGESWQRRVSEGAPSLLRLVGEFLLISRSGRVLLEDELVVDVDSRDLRVVLSEIDSGDIDSNPLFVKGREVFVERVEALLR